MTDSKRASKTEGSLLQSESPDPSLIQAVILKPE